jgi:hypothetical protein
LISSPKIEDKKIEEEDEYDEDDGKQIFKTNNF